MEEARMSNLIKSIHKQVEIWLNWKKLIPNRTKKQTTKKPPVNRWHY
jgi:hypothetical protein